jgi:hypothetical protein
MVARVGWRGHSQPENAINGGTRPRYEDVYTKRNTWRQKDAPNDLGFWYADKTSLRLGKNLLKTIYALKDLSKDQMLLVYIAIINQNRNPSPL